MHLLIAETHYMPHDPSSSFESHELQSPNLLPPEHRDESDRQHRQSSGRRVRFFSCFLVILFIAITSCSILIARSNNNFFVGIKNGFLVRQLTHFFMPSSNSLQGEGDDRINFLLLGIGGSGHEGPYLSDTIILASLRPTTGEAAMLSIPRDLIVPTTEDAYMKVNHVYALAQKQGIETAFKETKNTIGRAFGLPIHYMGVLDFQGFIELVDTIGGVTVTVERAFTDRLFPAGPNQYSVATFKEGLQRMDGLTALRFARSRHGNNGEGSDFARSRRQQQIILAVKEKVSSFNTLFNPRKIIQLFKLVNQYTRTDIEPWEAVKIIQLAKDIDAASIGTFVIDDAPGGYLASGISSLDGAYILQPKNGDYNELQLLALGMLKNSGFASENPKILILNGTPIPNLALEISNSLNSIGLKPVAYGNAPQSNYPITEVYDYTSGRKPNAKTYLESWLDIDVEETIPLELLGGNMARLHDLRNPDGTYAELDYLIILGEDIRTKRDRQLIRTLSPDELTARNATTTATSTEPDQQEDREDTAEIPVAGGQGETIPQ